MTDTIRRLIFVFSQREIGGRTVSVHLATHRPGGPRSGGDALGGGPMGFGGGFGNGGGGYSSMGPGPGTDGVYLHFARNLVVVSPGMTHTHDSLCIRSSYVQGAIMRGEGAGQDITRQEGQEAGKCLLWGYDMVSWL